MLFFICLFIVCPFGSNLSGALNIHHLGLNFQDAPSALSTKPKILSQHPVLPNVNSTDLVESSSQNLFLPCTQRS